MANSDSDSSFALGLVLGGVIGVAVGLLIAPKPGSETRAELAEASEVWRGRAEEVAAALRERVGPTVEGVRERVGPAVESVRERVSPVIEQVTTRIGRAQGIPPSDVGHEAAADSSDHDGEPLKEGQQA